MLLIRDEENVSKKFIKLLENREAKQYNLKVNKKFTNSIPAIFWNTIIKYYNKVEFVKLDADELYILEKINGENTNI